MNKWAGIAFAAFFLALALSDWASAWKTVELAKINCDKGGYAQ